MRSFERAISLCLIVVVILGPLPQQAYAAQAQGASPAKFKLVIVEGEGAINNVKQRLAREVIVQVDDENNQPIGGVAVTFLLPGSGPGGLFSNGAGLLNVTTNAAGRATAQFVPNSVGGAFQINVSASFQGQVSSTVITQTNAISAASTTAAGTAAGAGTGTGISATTIALIAVAVAGAIAVGVAAGGKDDDKPTPTPTTQPTAGTSTIRIGAAGPPIVGTPGFQQEGRMKKPSPKWR
jgi:hypothetical protein